MDANSSVVAEANIAAAKQTLDQALTGSRAEDIAAARLQVEQTELSLEQAQINHEKAEAALDDTQMFAPQEGTILSVNRAPGSFMGRDATA